MISQELLQGFISEASDLLDDIEPALVSYPKIEDESEREEVVNRVFRHFHSIKGSAGFVGLHDIARLTHEAETLLEQYRNNPGHNTIPQESITILCRTVDFLRMLFQDQSDSSVKDGADNASVDSAEYENLIREINGAITDAKRKNPKTKQYPRHDTTVQISLGKSGSDGKDEVTRVRRRSNTRVVGPGFNALEKQPPTSPPPPPPEQQRNTTRRTRAKDTKSKERQKRDTTRQTKVTRVEKSDTVRIIRATSQDAIEKLTKNEFLGRYITESNELLEQTEQALLQAEQHPEMGTDTIQEALRCLHSFKGNSGFMNFKDLERLSHRMETIIEDTIGRAAGLDAQTFDILLQVIDVLRQGIHDLSYGGSGEIPDTDMYIALLDAVHEEGAKSTRIRAQQTKIAQARSTRRDSERATEEIAKDGTDSGTEHITRVIGSSTAESGGGHDTTIAEVEQTRLMPLGKASDQEDLSERQRSTHINMTDSSYPLEDGKQLERSEASANYLKRKRETTDLTKTTDHVQTTSETTKHKRVSGQRIAVSPRNDIRVDLNKLDLMLDLVGELVIAETMVTRHPAVISQENESLERAVHQLRRVANSLQDMAMSVRMIPLVSTFRRMIRLVYDLSMKAGKLVDLILLGEETEVDRTVIERISDPLVHIIRNAIDHGIESPEERRRLGKPETGRVTIEGRHEGGEVWIVITDDGRGLSRDLIVKRAISKGLLVGDGSDLSDNQVYHFIFEPGFSTAEAVTDISGRGFGMDVVKKNIEKLSGRIDIRTREGEGTAVIMRIPLTLAIIDGMLVRAGDTRYIIPLLSIRESLKPDPEHVMKTPDGQSLIKLRNELIPIVKLDEVFSRVKVNKALDEGILMVVEGEDGGVVALFADELLGQQETVIKGLTGWLKKSRGVSGCTILGDGEVGLILDIGAIVKLASPAEAVK